MNADLHLGRSDLAKNYYRYLLQGLLAVAGTSGHSQGAGAAGVTRVRANEAAGLIVLPGLAGGDEAVVGERVATADVDVINEGSIIQIGEAIIIDRVVYRHYSTGALTYAFVRGAAAVYGNQVAPTNAAIQAAVGAGNPWLRPYRVLIRRTADTTVTAAFDNTVRPLGVRRTDDAIHTSEL